MAVFLIFTTIRGVLGMYNDNISVIISFPLQYIGGPIATWKRGLEILAGCYAAVKDINDDSGILSHYNLHLVEVDSGIDEYEILVENVDQLFSQPSGNIVGMCGILSPKAVALMLPLVRQSGRVLSSPSEQITQGSRNIMQAVVSPSTVFNILQSFMTKLEWTRDIGIITDSTDPYFFYISEMLMQSDSGLKISAYIEVRDFKSAVRKIIESNTRVTFINLSLQKAVQLMCEIYTNFKGLLWPKYAWIIVVFDIESVLEEWADCDIKSAPNGILLIETHAHETFPTNAKFISGVSYFTYHQHYLSSLRVIADIYNTTLEPNAYAVVLYNALWQIAVALNESTCYLGTQSICTATITRLQFSNDVTTTFYIRTLTQLLATAVLYNSTTIGVALNETALNSMQIKYESAIIGPPIGYTVGFAILITSTCFLVTFMLVLHICFKKEPEIKATSFSLSLLMFAGCYFNLFYITLLYYSVHTANTIDIRYQHVICNLFLWFSAPGISLPLMLAVLLVKIIRIYYIFRTFKAGLGRCWSDLSLAIYVALILSPNILVNVIWILSDRYHVKLEERIQNGHKYNSPECSSMYESIWIGVQFVYILILILAIVIIAIMTRKVRLQHFKDTKKVNVLLFLLCPGLATTFLYWLLLQILNAYLYVVTIPLLIGHSSLIISFQCFLIVPKVYPPFWRQLIKKSQPH